jgi:hypothetical protein
MCVHCVTGKLDGKVGIAQHQTTLLAGHRLGQAFANVDVAADVAHLRKAPTDLPDAHTTELSNIAASKVAIVAETSNTVPP